jgi:hypothetical protein
VDEALLAGVGVNRDGMSEASMGVAAGDLDGDGDEDLFMTHLIRETNTLYLNDGQGWFEERTAESGLALPSVPFTGFGTGFVDFDNDGRLDILSVNGGVTLYEPMQADDGPSPLGRSNQLFRNLGGARFADVTPQDPSFQRQEVSRGTAFGDVDNDGDTDVLVSNNNGPARLLLNTGNENGWLGVRLLDGKRNAIGARLALTPGPDGSALYRRVHTDGSYASASDPRVLFGLGERPAAAYELKVTWPGGQRESFQGLAPGRYHTLRKGEGKAAK